MQIKLFLGIIPLVCLFSVALAAPVNDIHAPGIGGVQGDDGLINDTLNADEGAKGVIVGKGILEDTDAPGILKL
ncbi:hypothetical protein PS15p_210235 [Mucor circinelloides]